MISLKRKERDYMKKLTRLILPVYIFVYVFPVIAFAQSSTGRLVGSVTGPDGIIAGATVVVTDNQTGKERTVTTSEDGTFTIPQLEPGVYTVKVTAPGFKTFTATDVKIDVSKEYNLNATLEVGQLEETVTVTAGADIVNATSGELSNTVSPRQIQELPLNGRDPLNLIQLQAGTASNGATNTAINGQRTSFTNITRDGINIQDNFIRANATDFAPQRPTVDNVEEFTLIAQNADASRGYGASQVTLVTPRGQNDFHGALYFYNRNSRLAANEFFNNADGIERPFLNRNQFGGRIAGPLWRDKLFFFGNYEGLRLRTQESVLRTILLPQARSGLFTYVDNAGATRTIDILGLAGFSGVNPIVASRILSGLPSVGNTTDRGDQRNTTGFRFNQRGNFAYNQYTTRFDFDVNQRNTINATLSYTDEYTVDRPDIDQSQDLNRGAGFGEAPGTLQPSARKFLATAWRTSPTATFTNEVRGGFFISDPIFKRRDQEPAFFLALPLISNPEVNFQQQGRNTDLYNIQDNAEWIRGEHAFRFGGQLQVFRIQPFGPGAFGASTIPTLNISTGTATPALRAAQFPGGISAAQLGTANSLLAILGGIVSGGNLSFNATSQDSGFVQGAPPVRNLDYENISLYFQDQWRVTPRLTLNLGLRYELFTPIREPNGLALEPVIPEGVSVTQAILDPNGIYDFVGRNVGGTNFFNMDKNNFAPVVSFAYSPQFKNRFLSGLFPDGGRTVLRGGFRMSYVNDEFVRAADNALSGNAGLSSTVTLPPQNLRLGDPLPTFTTPVFQVPRTFAENNALAAGFGTVFAIDPDLQVPRTLEYNFSIEREIGFQTAIEVRYVGGRSNNLVRGVDFNQVNILDNGFLEDFNRARSNLINFGSAGCANPATGCQPLTIFPTLPSGGLLTNATILNTILEGSPAQLAFLYLSNNLAGNFRPSFLANPNTGVVDLLGNGARYRYNALQTELRRRFTDGLHLQANYTFQKTLTDASGVGQTRFEPLLSNDAPELEYARAQYDQTHIFNFNTIYELPFGKGRRWMDTGGVADKFLGGWQVTSIIRVASGAPISITDPRGTLNRAGRSTLQTANSNLTKDQIKDLIGIFRTPEGVFFINPSVINPATGRASEGFGTDPFPGQVFFNVAPGETGNLERFFINGPTYFNWDASLIKNFQITEGSRFQFRIEAFNVLNRANFFAGQTTTLNINSTNFGRVTSTFDPRIVQVVGRIEF
jgi:hypothetical protein